MSKKAKGNRAEQHAAQYLEQHGLKVVERNFRIDGGEIDIIARSADWWVFLEVKYRSDEDFAPALEQITAAQCRRVRFAARCYLLQHGLDEHKLQLRFDVIAITGSNNTVYWLKDAF
ncbi:MAG: YraN family protein [Pseudomonadota bacterium]